MGWRLTSFEAIADAPTAMSTHKRTPGEWGRDLRADALVPTIKDTNLAAAIVVAVMMFMMMAVISPLPMRMGVSRMLMMLVAPQAGMGVDMVTMMLGGNNDLAAAIAGNCRSITKRQSSAQGQQQ